MNKKQTLGIAIFTLILFIACQNPFLPPKKEGNSNPQTPVILTQPIGGIYSLNDSDIDDIIVEAEVTDGGLLSFKWFSYPENNQHDITEIDEAEFTVLNNRTTFLPPVDEVRVVYYFVVAANTLNGKKAEIETEHARIEVAEEMLEGEASITDFINYRIGEILGVNTDGITNAAPPFNYQWKADGVNISAENEAHFVIDGAYAGRQISCDITHSEIAGSITATGGTVPYDVTVTKTGSVIETDNVTVSPDFGPIGTSIEINYTLDNASVNNRLTFSGINAAISQVTTAESGTRSYSIAAADAANGVITITATFTHTDLEPDTIAFANAGNETRTYGEAGFTKAISNSGSGTGAITYSSSSESVATVSSAGIVSILTAGTTTITAVKASDGTYAQTTASYTLTVNRKVVTITGLGAANKVYDRNTSATVTGTPALNGVINADEVTIGNGTASFANNTAANNKLVSFTGYSLGGAHAGNYNLSAQPASVTANITQRQLTRTGTTITATRIYNATTTANVTNAGSLQGVIAGDTVTLSGVANYNNADVGTAKPVTVVFTISGLSAVNYIKPDDWTTTASITRATGATINDVATMASRTTTSITANPATLNSHFSLGPTLQSIEYAITESTSMTAPITGWQAELSFTGLNTGTVYYIWARSLQSTNFTQGTPLRSAAISTLQPEAGVGITITDGLTKETVMLDKNGVISIDANEEITISVVGDYSSYIWFINSALIAETENSITINGINFVAGNHQILVTVYKDGNPYSQYIYLNVRN